MPAVEPVTLTEEKKRAANGHWRRFFLAAATLTLCFGLPLFNLLRFAVHDELYSYIPLIPIVSVYLVWSRRRNLPACSGTSPKTAFGFFAGGLATVAGYWLAVHFNSKLAVEDSLALTTLAFLFFFTGAGFRIFGKEILRAVAFPVALLIFMVPLPVFLRDAI